MKSTVLFGLFLLSFFTSYPPSATAQPVTDMYGNVVTNPGTFYILPLIRGSGGGITRQATGNETCPLSVVQSRNEVNKGLPLRISSPARSGFIPEGRLEIGFTAVPLCATTPSQWTVVKGLPEGQAVKITGYANTVKGSFIIQSGSTDNSYELLFCEFNSSSECGAIGIVRDNQGIRHLAVTDNNPFQFVLQQISTSSHASV